MVALRKFQNQDFIDFFNQVKKEYKINKKKEMPPGNWAFNSININQSFYFNHLMNGDIESCDKTLAKIVLNAFYLYCIHKEYLRGRI